MNINKIMLLTAIGFNLSAKMASETGKPASTTVKWQLEFMNKREMPVKVEVRNISGALSIDDKITTELGAKGSSNSWLRISGIDINKPVAIRIYPSGTNRSMKERGKLEAYEGDKFTTNGYGLYFDKLSNPLFLTLDYDLVRPQTGTLSGFSGKTESGLSQTNALKLDSIKQAETAFIKKYPKEKFITNLQ